MSNILTKEQQHSLFLAIYSQFHNPEQYLGYECFKTATFNTADIYIKAHGNLGLNWKGGTYFVKNYIPCVVKDFTVVVNREELITILKDLFEYWESNYEFDL